MFIRTIPIYLVFLLMGVADAIGPLSSQVEKNPLLAAWMPFFVFIAFALFSIPGGVLAARIGKKNLLLMGLGLCATATAVPCFITPPFGMLLASIFLLGVGTTFLQVAGNPIMRDVSPEGSYSRNLAMAQGIKGVGSTASAFLVTAVVSIALFATMEWRGAFPIFFTLMVLAFLSVAMLKVNEAKADVPSSMGDCISLLGIPTFAMAVLGIFLYVGAEVCLATYLKPAFEVHGYEEKLAAFYGPSLFLGTLTIGRLLGGVIKVDPRAFFRISSLLGIIGLAMLLLGIKALMVPAVVLGGLGCANIWPMLFSITVEERPERASELSGLMCMAISGGALMPLAMGWLGGGTKAIAFVVPAVCFAYLMLLSMRKGKTAVGAQ
ncbi:MAG: MFS transporter [Holophagaceae bacterium]|nr:MFS transporter [Holophagaceae bacterium]